MTMTDLKAEILEFLQAAHSEVLTVYLFGSQARGTEGPRSDVDIAVLLEKDPPSTLEGMGLSLEAEIESHLGKEVDLIILNTAPVDLIHRVLRDGQLILDRDPSRRIRFEVQARNEYFDLLPLLRRCRRQERKRS